MKRKQDLTMDLFDFSPDKYYITKPIRLIEFFAGIGFTHQGIKRVFPNVQSWKIAEWGIPSILGYDAVHNGDNNNLKEFSEDFLVEKLTELGISANYDVPATKDQIKRMGVDKLNKIYNAILRTNNLVNVMNVKGSDLEIVDTDKYEYILTYSFPCQDLSLAGQQKGMEISQAEGGTRSGLVWEVLRILKECENKPQILIMENVPQIHSIENNEQFVKLQLELENLGYTNFWKDLNGVDFGVPQNRVRTFMVSILGKGQVYSFPEATKLNVRLLDVLEKEVDEKYFISSKMMDYITTKNEKYTGNNNGAIINKEIAGTITTREGNTRCDASTYICNDLPNNFDLQNNEIKQVGNIYDNEYNSQAGRIYDPQGLAPTIDTMDGGNRQPKIVVNEYVGTFDYAQSDTLRPNVEDRFHKDNVISGTILASGNQNGILIREATNQGYKTAHKGDGVNLSSRMQHQRGNVQKGIAQTLKTCCEIGVVVEETLKKELCDKMIVENQVKEGDVVKHSYTQQILDGKKKCVEKEGEMITLTTRPDCLGVCVSYGNKALNETIKNNNLENGTCLDCYNKTANSEIVGTLTTGVSSRNETFIAVQENSLFTETEKQLFTEDGNIRRYIGSDKIDEFKNGEMATTTFPNGYGHGPRTHKESIALNTVDRPVIKQNLRIRKLTPLECVRLMGAYDEVYYAMKNIAKLTDAQIYHIAGDGLIPNIIEKITLKLKEGGN